MSNVSLYENSRTFSLGSTNRRPVKIFEHIGIVEYAELLNMLNQ